MHHFVVMGVAGCGKSTVAKALARRFEWEFVEGDELHDAASVEKMSSGEALTDDDRWPWLQRIGQKIATHEQGSVTSCSALRRAYREVISQHATKPVHFIHLATQQSVILARMNKRKGHFMPPSLLASQFETLEPLELDESGVTVDINRSIDDVVADAVNYAHLQMNIAAE